jgi:hypothetical protein
LTKTVTVWVPDVRWRANWYGSYSGKIYKDIKQPYADPYNGGNTYKYILYISDNVISETQDFSYAKSKADAKIILAGKPGIKDGNTYHHFIDATGKTIDEITDEALNYIAQASPAVEEVIILQNETFELHTVILTSKMTRSYKSSFNMSMRQNIMTTLPAKSPVH